MGFKGGPGTADPTRRSIESYTLFVLIMRALSLGASLVCNGSEMEQCIWLALTTTPSQFLGWSLESAGHGD
jgi:hypothetical protein